MVLILNFIQRISEIYISHILLGYYYHMFIHNLIYILFQIIFLKLPQMNTNPRMTNFVSTTKDQENAAKIINDFRNHDNPSLHWILCKWNQCDIIRTQPEFLQILFNERLNLVMEMIQWMLTPKLIAKRKKIKSNLDFFPYRCKEFMRDNLPFYDQLYISAKKNRLPITLWFNFLRKQFYDQQTITTALGYFAQVMIPLAKYEFSSSPGLTQSVTLSTYDPKLQPINIMKIMTKPLLQQIIQYAYHQGIFQFLKTAVLVCYEDPSQFQICKSVLLKIFQKAQYPQIFSKHTLITPQTRQQFQNKIQMIEHIGHSLKQLIANIDPTSEIQLKIQKFINCLLQSKLIPYVIRQIINSDFCRVEKFKGNELSSSMELMPKRTGGGGMEVNLFASQGKISSPLKVNQCVDLDLQAQDIVESLLRILVFSVQIFIRIPKALTQIHDTIDSVDLNQQRQQEYKNMINVFHQQMQLILNDLDIMTRIVYKQQQPGNTTPFKTILFSSGQKIKSISYMKYKFFMLLHNCLIMTQCGQNFESKIQKALMRQSIVKKSSLRRLRSISIPQFQIKIQKLFIIEIIQKYLNQNRWNNIVHHLLEKIFHALVICNYEYLKKNLERDLNKKTNQSFLAFLIQNFTQRHYIFLSTLKFTTQGNLQSLYNISKDLAYTLNSTNQLVIMLNQFEPWKKFLMTDLKVYEQKSYPDANKPDNLQDDQVSYQEVSGLKVDEADSIRKLIEDISNTKKWPMKVTKNKGMSKSGILRNSDEQKSVVQTLNLSNSRQYYVKIRKQKTIQNFLKKKIEYNRRFKKDEQIQQLDVQGISVRQQLQKQYGINQKNTERHHSFSPKIQTKSELYNIFQKYSSGSGSGGKNQRKQ